MFALQTREYPETKWNQSTTRSIMSNTAQQIKKLSISKKKVTSCLFASPKQIFMERRAAMKGLVGSGSVAALNLRGEGGEDMSINGASSIISSSTLSSMIPTALTSCSNGPPDTDSGAPSSLSSRMIKIYGSGLEILM